MAVLRKKEEGTFDTFKRIREWCWKRAAWKGLHCFIASGCLACLGSIAFFDDVGTWSLPLKIVAFSTFVVSGMTLLLAAFFGIVGIIKPDQEHGHGDYDGSGSSGGPCNGSGGPTCSGGTTRGFTKIESMLTSVIACALAEDCHANADLVINCRKLAPVNGRAQLDGCGCVKPCKDCKCRRELGEHSTQSEGTADADSQLKRAEHQDDGAMDVQERLSGGHFAIESINDVARFPNLGSLYAYAFGSGGTGGCGGRTNSGKSILESVDSFIAKLAKIAFPNANCPALSLAYCGGGAYGRGGGVYGRGGPFGHKVQDDGGSFGCSGGGAYGRGGPFGRGGGVYG